MSQESRSFGAIVVSVVIHAGAICAIAMAPQNFLGHKDTADDDVELATTNNLKDSFPDSQPPVAAPVASTQPKPVVKARHVAKAKPVVAAAKKFEPKDSEKDDTVTEAQVADKEVAKQDSPPEDVDSAVSQQEESTPVAADSEKDQEPLAKAEPVVAAADSTAKTDEAAPAAVGTAAATEVPPSTPSSPQKSDDRATTGAAGSATGAGAGVARDYTELRQRPGNSPPEYPEEARKEQRQGDVDLVYYVTADGGVRDVRVLHSSGSADLDQSASAAVQKYKYFPGQEGWTQHPVHFSLKGEPQPAASRLRTSQNTPAPEAAAADR